MDKSLNDLDREILRVYQEDSDRLRLSDEFLDVDALGSTQQLKLLIDLYIRGWTPEEIKVTLVPRRESFHS